METEKKKIIDRILGFLDSKGCDLVLFERAVKFSCISEKDGNRHDYYLKVIGRTIPSYKLHITQKPIHGTYNQVDAEYMPNSFLEGVLNALLSKGSQSQGIKYARKSP